MTALWSDFHSTGTVLGLFKEWASPTVECELAAGDTLALYTDGVTESSMPGEKSSAKNVWPTR